MARVSYMTVGSNKLEAAKVFYDALLGSIGMTGVTSTPRADGSIAARARGCSGCWAPMTAIPPASATA
jgi:hypothetical protein